MELELPLRDQGFAGKYIPYEEKSSIGPWYAPFLSWLLAMEKKFPDVSFYQGMINWDKMRTMTDAAIIRVGQNIWTDTEFLRNWYEAKRVGIKRGAYFFYDDRATPEAQAALAIELLKDDPPEMELFVDWENTYRGPYNRLYDVVKCMKLIEAGLPNTTIGMYTGYYWFIEHTSSASNPYEYAYLASRPLWEAWYTSVPSYVKVPAPWTRITHWQYGTPAVGASYGVQSGNIDMNFFNGTIAEFNEKYHITEPAPPPIQPGDEHIMSHNGIDWYHIRRFETDCYIWVIDLTRVTTKIHYGFETVFDAVKNAGAQLGFNMGGWGNLAPGNVPDEYLIIDGVVKQDQMEGSGWIEISKDNKITIDDVHPNFLTSWNLWGFDRIIAKNRVYNPLIDNPYPEPRTINGNDSQGRLVILICEGRSTTQKGLTFPEVWEVLGKEFDVVNCGNADGGYSSAGVDTFFDPPLLNTTYLVENRKVISQLLFYADGGAPPPGGIVKTYQVMVAVKPRPTPSISGGTSSNVPAGTTFQSDTVVAGSPAGTNFVKYITGEWLPLIYNGVEYVKEVVAPPTTVTIDHADVYLTDGSMVTLRPV